MKIISWPYDHRLLWRHFTLCIVFWRKSSRRNSNEFTQSSELPLFNAAILFNNPISDAELAMEGFCLYRKDRPGRVGGGLVLYINDNIQSTEVTDFQHIDFEESVWCRLSIGGESLLKQPGSAKGREHPFWTISSLMKIMWLIIFSTRNHLVKVTTVV